MVVPSANATLSRSEPRAKNPLICKAFLFSGGNAFFVEQPLFSESLSPRRFARMANDETELKARVTEIETDLRTTIDEINRIETVLIGIDGEINKMINVDGEQRQRIKRLQGLVNEIVGLMALDRATDEQKTLHQSAVNEIETLNAQKASDIDTQLTALRGKRKAVENILIREMDKQKALEAEYPGALRAVAMEKAVGDLKEFMKLSEKMAALVTKLAVLNNELDGVIFYSGAGFALPKPLVEPFKSQAEGKDYYFDDCNSGFSARVLRLDETLKRQIEAAQR